MRPQITWEGALIRVRQVFFSEHIDAAVSLIRDNWGETGFDFPLRLDIQAYIRFESLGMLVTVGAFEEDTLVGYATAMVATHPYNPSVRCGNSDALFVARPHRNGRTAALIMRELERAARAKGATRMLWHARAGTNFGTILERRGYKPTDVVLMREL